MLYSNGHILFVNSGENLLANLIKQTGVRCNIFYYLLGKILHWIGSGSYYIYIYTYLDFGVRINLLCSNMVVDIRVHPVSTNGVAALHCVVVVFESRLLGVVRGVAHVTVVVDRSLLFLA